MRNLFFAFDSPGSLLQVLDYSLHSQVDSSSKVHGVHSGSNWFAAFAENGTREDGGGCGSVTSDVVGFVSNLKIF